MHTKCPLGTAYLAETKKFFAETTIDKGKSQLNSVVKHMNSTKNAMRPMNSSKNKLKVEIS